MNHGWQGEATDGSKVVGTMRSLFVYLSPCLLVKLVKVVEEVR